MERKIAVLIDLKEYLPDDEPYNRSYVDTFIDRFARLTKLPHTPPVKQSPTTERWWIINFSVPEELVEDFCVVMDNFMFVQAELV
jgi:hypothetical protein